MKRVALLIVLLCVPALATNHYVRQGASGTGDGLSWANACTDFAGSCAPNALVRGDVYYVASGAYCASGCTFTQSESGVLYLTIQGATVADHGSSTGWNAAYSVSTSDGGSQATFGDGMAIYNSYTSIDGSVGSGSTRSSYGFASLQGNCGTQQQSILLGAGGYTMTDITISHMAFLACAGDIQKGAIGQQSTTTVNNLTVSHSLFDGFQSWIFIGAPAANGFVAEYNYVRNQFSSASHHGGGLNMISAVTNPVIRYNTLLDCTGTACIEANDTGVDCPTGVVGAQIYGNVIGPKTDTNDNGSIASTTRCFFKNALIFNNTVSNGKVPFFTGCISGAAQCTNATGNVQRNNLIDNMDATPGTNVGTPDYDYFTRTTNTPSEANGQISASNPFVSVGNYHLASDTAAWNGNAGGPAGNAVDGDGVTRTSSRGAYQFVTIGGVRINAGVKLGANTVIQ